MQTKKIEIDQKNTHVAQIMEVTEQFAQYLELEKKQRFYLNILVEESLGMIGMIAESFKGFGWKARREKTARSICSFGPISMRKSGRNC